MLSKCMYLSKGTKHQQKEEGTKISEQEKKAVIKTPFYLIMMNVLKNVFINYAVIYKYLISGGETQCAGPVLEYRSTTEVWPLVS